MSKKYTISNNTGADETLIESTNLNQSETQSSKIQDSSDSRYDYTSSGSEKLEKSGFEITAKEYFGKFELVNEKISTLDRVKLDRSEFWIVLGSIVGLIGLIVAILQYLKT